MNKDSDLSMSANDWHQRNISSYYNHSNSAGSLTTRTPQRSSGYQQVHSLSFPSYSGYRNYEGHHTVSAPQSEELALVPPDTFRSSSQGTWDTTQSQFSPYNTSPHQNSMLSYREVGLDRNVTPNGQYMQSQIGNGQYYPPSNDQSQFTPTHFYNTSSNLIRQNLQLQQQRQLGYFKVPALSQSIVGFDPKDHKKLIVIESPDSTHMMRVNNKFKDYEATEDVKSFSHENKFVTFITLIKEPTSGQTLLDLKYRKYSNCPEYYVKEPSKVYIQGPLKNNNKLQFSTEAVDRLFQIFGYHKILAEAPFYVLYVDSIVLQGIKNHFKSRIVNGRLELDINLADELATKTLLQDDSSDPDSPESSTAPSPIIRSKVIIPKKRNSSISRTLVRHGRKAPEDVHDLTSDDEMRDVDEFSIPDSDSELELYERSSRKSIRKSSKRPLKISGGELIKAIDDDQDDDVMESKSAEPKMAHEITDESDVENLEDEHPKSRVIESQVISDIDSATEQEIDSEDEVEDEDDGESFDNFEAVYEPFSKNHSFSVKDVDSKILIIRFCPQGNKKKHDFVEDLLRLDSIKFEISKVYFDSKQHETYLEFFKKSGVINGVKQLHGHKYSGNILSTVLCDNRYAKKVYV